MLAIQAAAGNAALARVLQGDGKRKSEDDRQARSSKRLRRSDALQDAPRGRISRVGDHITWTTEAGKEHELEPLERSYAGDILRDHRRRFATLYIVVEPVERAVYHVVGATETQPDVGVLLGTQRLTAERSGTMSTLRIRRDWQVTVDYRWLGTKETGVEQYRLDAEKHVESTDLVPRNFIEVFPSTVGPHGIRLFKRKKDIHRQLQPGKGKGSQQGKQKKQKGRREPATPGVNPRALGEVIMRPKGARGDPGDVMGRKADEAARAAGRRVGGEWQNYEWCHLLGHGEGGRELRRNLIAATAAANTEQLAIEEGFRWGRTKYGHKKMRALVTAYALPGHPDVARSIRYKIIDARPLLAGGKRPADDKIVDRLIDGDSQHFDMTDRNVLRETVKAAIQARFEPPSAPAQGVAGAARRAR